MKTINLNTGENIQQLVFPDQQPHVRVTDVQEGDYVRVVCAIRDTVLLLQLLQTANALDHLFAKKKELVIPYLMAARYDRIMQTGDSLDIEVVANLINSCGFEKVILLDVHSEVSGVLIKNAVLVNNQFLVTQYQQPDAVLICPDAGAAKKVDQYFKWNYSMKEIVYCNKKRDLSNGRLTLDVLEPERCADRNCVIIDDLCDGGATFLNIAQQIKPKHLTLIVTHGIFSKGFEKLEKNFDEIIVSNSYSNQYNSKKIKMIDYII